MKDREDFINFDKSGIPASSDRWNLKRDHIIEAIRNARESAPGPVCSEGVVENEMEKPELTNRDAIQV